MSFPCVRALEPKWIEYEGQPALVLTDRLGLSQPVIVPQAVALILSLCDGTRDVAGIKAAVAQQAGLEIDEAVIQDILDQLAKALVLEGPAAEEALARAVEEYRSGSHREAALAGLVYPADAADLTQALIEYARLDQPGRLALGLEAAAPSAPPRGLISPHIDYQRGGPLYARTWLPAARALREADLVVIFGTDHSGGLGQVTLTRHDFATPYGVLRTDRELMQALTDRLDEDLYEEEFHHRNEHSIELAAVWLHFARDGEPVPLVPVLCGHPVTYMHAGRIDPQTFAGRAIAALRRALAGRRVLAVAAADLAHVGPAFGDPRPFNMTRKAAVRAADEELIAASRRGAAGVLQCAGRIGDRYRICGLAPIAAMLELIGPSEPETLCYDQCPADDDAGSIVSIAGVLMRPL